MRVSSDADYSCSSKLATACSVGARRFEESGHWSAQGRRLVHLRRDLRIVDGCEHPQARRETDKERLVPRTKFREQSG